MRSLDKERRRNTVFSLTLSAGQASRSEDGATDPVTVMIRDVQFDPMSRQIIHVDFLRVSLDDEVKVTVPLVLKGTPVGVVNGGNLHHNVYDIPIAAKPADIPLRIECDVSALNIGAGRPRERPQAAARASGALLEPKASLASVVAPKAEKVEEAAPAAAAAGAEGAAAAPAGEGAAAAAPAAGGKGEKGKEAAPAKGKEAPAKDEKKGK